MESILETLRAAKAPLETIRAQEKIVAALPKPKPGKPLMDAGNFHQALSQAKEHHSKVAQLDDLNVEACQRAITKAQTDMEQAIKTQKENKAQAEKTFAALRGLIAKAQEESQETFLPVHSEPARQTHPDHDLLLHDLLDTISPVIKASPHLQEFLKHGSIVPKDPTGVLPRSAQLTPIPADAQRSAADQVGESKGGKGSGTKDKADDA